MTNEIHWRKGTSRYYKIITHKDMFSKYTVTCIWGGINSRLGNYKTHSFANRELRMQFIDDLSKRREQRGYIKIDRGNLGS